MALIRYLKNKLGNIIFPITKTKAVYDDDNNTLDDILSQKIDTSKIIEDSLLSVTEDGFIAGAKQTAEEINALKKDVNLRHYPEIVVYDGDISVIHNYSANMLPVSKYSYILDAHVMFPDPISNGGRFLVEGFKSDNNYESIKLYSYWDNCVVASKIKFNGVWYDFDLIATKTYVDNMINNKLMYESWNTISSLQNGWTGTISYAKNGNGRVRLSGTITPGTKLWDTLIATIPIGYRPYAIWLPIDVFSAGGSVIQGVAINGASGEIKIFDPATANTDTNEWLLCIEYDTK